MGLQLSKRFGERATYHSRLDIPKMDYPLLIQTCLKAWADFCEDSYADGILS
jgi:hypothetical protein